MSALADGLVLGAARVEIAEFLRALLLVYTILIFAYILSSLVQSAGMRIPYSGPTSAVLGFLRAAVEPYLSIFRRFIPPLGPIDLSPIVGILLLQIVGGLVIGLVAG